MKTTKKCDNCGFDNDLLMTSCLKCRTPLKVDKESISDEVLVMNTGEWVGKTGQSSIQQDADFSYFNPSYLKKKFLNNSSTGVASKGYVEYGKKGIEKLARQYLDLLKERSETNPNLRFSYENLQKEFDKKRRGLVYKLGGAKNIMVGIMFLFMLMIVLGPIIMVILMVF